MANAALGQETLVTADVEKAISLGAPPEGIESVLNYVRERVNPDQD